MLRPLHPAALVAAVWLAAGSAGAQADAFEARARREIAAWIEARHFDPAHVDPAAVLSELKERKAASAREEAFRQTVRALVDQSYFRVGRPGAAHADAYRYARPFPPSIPRYLAQGNAGRQSHQDPANLYAFDFTMLIGSPVWAAREGVVARVIDGFDTATPGDPDPLVGFRSNEVVILHDDGSWAGYLHLQKGIPVVAGQRVKRGQPIGSSGMSGSPFGPHLHFSVQKNAADGGHVSVPIRFGEPGSAGYVPEMGQFYGTEPPTNARLEVTLDGRALPKDTPVPWKRHAVGRLQVTLIERSGARRDVTTDPHTRIDAMTPWCVVVEDGARLRASRDFGFDHMYDVEGTIAIVQLLHVDPARKVIARAVVSFEIRN